MCLLKENNKFIQLNSFFVAILVNTPVINQICVAIRPLNEISYMTILYIASLIGLFIGIILFQKGKYYRYNIVVFLIVIFFIGCYYLTKMMIGKPYTEDNFFWMFTIMSLIVPAISVVDTRLLLLFVMYTSLPGFFYVNIIFTFNYNNVISMGLSYAFLMPICASICYVFTYLVRDCSLERVLNTLVAMTNMIYLVYLFQFGSRGPALSIVLLLMAFSICSIKEKNYTINKSRLVTYIVVTVVLYIFLIPIFSLLRDLLLDYFGVSLNFIDKFLSLEDDSSDISNGRFYLIEMVISEIMDSPLWGYGVDQFYNNTGVNYPHNFLIQMCYDLGCIFSFVFMYFVVRRIKKMFDDYNRDNIILLFFVFFSAVPGALFSNDLWNNISLWFCFGFVFSNTFCYKTHMS